ncbi:A24 family peptidase [Candidatus Aenigmatarchaeota archaeon]
MIEIFAIIGSALAGAWDLKTTEVPDEVPYIMTFIGIVYWFFIAIITGNFYTLFISLTVGSVILVAGLILYHTGKWGGADAWILAAIAYMVPMMNGKIFMIDYMMNFLIVSIVYMVIYSISLGIKNRVFSVYLTELRKRILSVTLIPIAYGIIAFIPIILIPGAIRMLPSFLFSFLLIICLVLFWVYTKVIEKHVFTKKISVSKLREGDVLAADIWVGLTASQVKDIQKKKKFVTIKEGIRFVPVFAITLVTTLLWGNLFFVVL